MAAVPPLSVRPSWSPATEMVALDGRRVTSHAIEGPRSATPADVAEIIALVDAEMRAGTHQTLLTDYPLVYAPANLRNVRVIAVDGRIVSVVPFLPRRIRFGAADIGIAIISPTATEPAYRHQGLASRCLESCLDRMREADCLLSALWTRERTFPFYERAGYRAIASQAFRYRLAPEDATRFAIDPRVRLEPLDPTDQASLDRIQRIHERDGDGIHRQASEYRPLFSLPVMQTLVARRDGLLVGYAIISAALNKPGLIEAGGDRPAIETLIHHALTHLGSRRSIDGHANLGQTALSIVLDRAVPYRRTVVEGGLMLRIDDVPRLLKALGADSSADEDVPIGDWPYSLFGSHPARRYEPPEGLAVRLGIPLPVPLTIPVLDRS